MSKNNIGPTLPPGFCSGLNDENTSDTEAPIGPALPPGFHGNTVNDTDDAVIGPVFPQSTSRKEHGNMNHEDEISSSSTSRSSTRETFGPRVSVSSSNQSDMTSYGPALPPGFEKSAEVHKDVGEDDDEDDRDVIGPMPATGLEVSSSVASDFEARAEAMKNKLTGNVQEKVERETWMMELPDYGKNFGLGPRTFRKKAAPSKQDRSGWTETPADRERRMKEAQAKAMAAASGAVPDSTSKPKKDNDKEKSNRDKEIEERITSFNTQTRGVSLVDMHQKELKRKMEEDSQSQERRPFNREVDLQVNRFDDAKKKRLIKESAKLNDKFAHGSDKVYL